MNILYIANVRMPTEKAHGIQIMKTCEAFKAVGNEIELVVPFRKTPIADDPFAYYGITHRFPLTVLPVPDLIRFGRIGFLLASLIFSERARLRKAFWKADIIYSRDAFVLLQYLLLRRKLVFEAHARPTALSRFVAKRAYRTIVISNGLKEVYTASGVPADRIIVAPDAVDEHRFDAAGTKAEARDALSLSRIEKIVVYVGHLYARKGADTLAHAAAQLPDVHFVFVGGTSKDLDRFREEWKKAQNVTIVGHVLPVLVPRYLRAADILVIPNSGKDEDASRFTSPMKLFEYMASGTPIIASDVPAIREILSDEDALLVAPDDPLAFASAIEQVFANESAARERAVAARHHVTEYTWAKRAERIIAAVA